MTRFVVIAITLAAAAWPGRAGAQPTLEDQARQKALAGVEAFKAGRTKDALGLLLEARERARLPRVLWNIARCHEALGNPAEGLPYLREIDTLPEDPRDPGLKAMARAKVVEIEGRAATPTEGPRPEPVATPAPPISAAPAQPPVQPAQAVHAKARPALSPMKAALFWGGLGTAVVGAAVHISGYVDWRHVTDGRHSYATVAATQKSARARYYAAFGLYAGAAASFVLSFVIPAKGRHPVGIGLAPTPSGVAMDVTLPF